MNTTFAGRLNGLAIPELRMGNMAAIAQLGERQTEDLEVPNAILGHGKFGCLREALCVPGQRQCRHMAAGRTKAS